MEAKRTPTVGRRPRTGTVRGAAVTGVALAAVLGGFVTACSNGPTGKYTDEECAALELSGASGDTDSAAEWDANC